MKATTQDDHGDHWAISCENLGVVINNQKIIEDVSFNLLHGSFLAVMGPNGAGKTVLLKTLVGLIRAQSGKVEILGRPMDEGTPRKVGYVPQVKTLDRGFPAMAIELVVSGLTAGWPARIAAKDADHARSILHICGVSHLADRQLSSLSGGQLQRVYIARALLRRPDLLLLDEPATGVDKTGEADFYETMETIHKQSRVTVVMVTHDRDAATYHASHVLLLNQRLIGFGKPSEVLTEDMMHKTFSHQLHTHAAQEGRHLHD